jgi:hypothetical protein
LSRRETHDKVRYQTTKIKYLSNKALMVSYQTIDNGEIVTVQLNLNMRTTMKVNIKDKQNYTTPAKVEKYVKIFLKQYFKRK